MGLRIQLAKFTAIKAFCLFVSRGIRFENYVGLLDVGTERRIGENYIEATLEDTIDVYESVVMPEKSSDSTKK